MKTNIKEVMNKIEIPKELRNRSEIGVVQAKAEAENHQRKFPKKWFGIAATFIVATVLMIWLYEDSTPNTTVLNEDGSIEIPAVEIPEQNVNADMIGLIVYKGNIYTQTDTEITAENAKAIVGHKLGKTKSTIDEWSSQQEYDEEFASTVGVTDVYTVKGYDENFRIMTYVEVDGETYAQFFEHLNGFSLKNGADVFGKLNMVGNIVSATFRTFNDWDYNVDNYQLITELEIVHEFVEALNYSQPFIRNGDSEPIAHARNDEQFREVIISLQDGTKVRLKLLAGNYIYYSFMDVYFEMEEDVFSRMWGQLQ